ncbi:hypothetical protein AMECASPLE_010239 [Ameca splendens]|uniref:USP domain-containing protein n=1 Tax=Ameca splendens TaxID=208324 RepID=A0ABV0YBH1_9TELE
MGLSVTPSSGDRHINSETTANRLTSKTSENRCFVSVPEVKMNLNIAPSSGDRQVNSETTANASPEEDRLQHEMITEVEDSTSSEAEISEHSQISCELDPTMKFCKFSNSFNNCWMNAAMQSILNLRDFRKLAVQNPEEVFGPLSGTPLFASLLLKAVHHPGKYFSPVEIYKVLMEIREIEPSLRLGQQNDIADFLVAILDWLKPCGINTACMLNNIATCEQCKVATPVLSELGPVVFMPDAKPNDTTASLLHRFFLDDSDEKHCNICFSNIKTNIFFSHTDVLALHVQRSTNRWVLGG